MKRKKLIWTLSLAVFLFAACTDDGADQSDDLFTPIDFTDVPVADSNADDAVFWLRDRLQSIGQQGTAFGHQDATAYGFRWEHSGFPSDSDILRVTGDYPAVIGFDIGKIENGSTRNIESIDFSLLRELIREAHDGGSIVTLSWHADNPITGLSSWHTEGRVERILPGGISFDRLDTYIARVATFMNSLTDDDGQLIPIIFRPWHEMNGDWFWWGSDLLSPQQYQDLFRATVDLLTDEYQVHNLLYAYSPNWAVELSDYMMYYPGDDYVDLLGVDIYDHLDDTFVNVSEQSLANVAEVARSSNKLFAFTETGLENVVEDNWWSEKLYPLLNNSGAVFALVWRNDPEVHWFAPYDGHPSEDDFRDFVSRPDILLRQDIR